MVDYFSVLAMFILIKDCMVSRNCRCMITGFRREATSHGAQERMTEYCREATSHGVRNNRNPTQVPEAARRVGTDAIYHSARSAPLKQAHSHKNQMIHGQQSHGEYGYFT